MVNSQPLVGSSPCASVSKPVNRALSKQELLGISTGPPCSEEAAAEGPVKGFC